MQIKKRFKIKLPVQFVLSMAILSLISTGCMNLGNSNQNLVLKGTSAEMQENVVLDPAFVARQKQAEKSFFGFSNLQNELSIADDASVDGDDEELIESESSYSSAKPNERMASNNKHNKGSFGGIEVIWPTEGKLSSLFGMRKLKHKTRMHAGIDISAPMGTPIYSSADGQILFTGRKRGYGQSVIMSHNSQHETLYAHMSRSVVRDGQFIRRGQIIGYVGKTGRVTGSNLHYETRINGIAYNPMLYLPPSADGKLQKGMHTPSLVLQMRYYNKLKNFAFVKTNELNENTN